ncbi:hypothetical protein [Acanthopleuribacter pedis]|uniref:Uncharacterized protein n=1 Tax=Acanthopleuribacter pedis TaxID=442870 RepID=A0A8J7QAU0_9BACT|nr:hypothetical protein [Acanthopleuribacter pedis]MBO1317396.1 hypothetical protein [Acanthopleuribacter pedis]
MKAVNVLLILVGVAMFGFGSLLTLGGVIALNDPEKADKVIENVIMISLFGIAPMVGGSLMIMASRKRMKQNSGEVMERRLLRLAHDNGGRLTVALATMHLNMPSQEVKKLLDECHGNGLANIHANDKGEVEYLFFDQGRASLS